MDGRLPLPTMLSHALVAFTIEFDNEAERRMAHRTTRHGVKGSSLHAPWLVSMVMWSNCMQFVGESGVRVGELENLARTSTNLAGLERWRYIVIEPDPTGSRPKPPRSTWIIRATPAGRQAQEVWRPLSGIIEKRWRERFGTEEIDRLRESLWAVATQLDADLPDCLPILGYGLFNTKPGRDGRPGKGQPRKERPKEELPKEELPKEERAIARSGTGADLPLPALLSRVLLAFAIEFEGGAEVSLAISANVVRVLDEKGVRVRDLPLLTGVSKEAISTALGFLRKRRVAVVEADPDGGRWKVARLTSKGREAQNSYRQKLSLIEESWEARFGKDTTRALRESLEKLAAKSAGRESPLFLGLEPHPDGWRASVPRPETLPHYPMVLHRGGFPDGS